MAVPLADSKAEQKAVKTAKTKAESLADSKAEKRVGMLAYWMVASTVAKKEAL